MKMFSFENMYFSNGLPNRLQKRDAFFRHKKYYRFYRSYYVREVINNFIELEVFRCRLLIRCTRIATDNNEEYFDANILSSSYEFSVLLFFHSLSIDSVAYLQFKRFPNKIFKRHDFRVRAVCREIKSVHAQKTGHALFSFF